MENVSNTPELSNIDSNASEGSVDTSVNSTENNATEPKLSGENDPNESFSSWLERQNSKKETKTEPKQEKSEKTVLKGTGNEKVEPKETKQAEAKDVSKDSVEKTSKPEQVSTEAEIKVGDKSFKAKDLEKVLADAEALKTNETKVTKQLQDLVRILKENPGSVLDRLEVPRETLEKYYYEKYLEFDQLTPEQKVEKLQAKERDRVEAERKAQQESVERERYEANRKYWAGVIKESLDSEGVPETEWTVQRMAGYIKQAKDKGIQASNQEIAKLVKEDLQNAQKAALAGLRPEELTKVLGDEAVKALRQHELKSQVNVTQAHMICWMNK